MKKIVLAVMAVAAIGFTACGNKTQQAEAVDSVAIIDSLAAEAAEGPISALTEQIDAKDASKFQEALATVKEKIAELIKSNPEVAKEYVAKVQTFLKDNTDKIKEFVGDNAAIASAVEAITSIEPANVVSGFLSAVDSTATNVKDAAIDAKDAAVDAANQKIEEGKQAVEDKANEVKDAAKQKANDAIDGAAKDVKKGLGL